jgi:hypothetical protein
MRILCNILVVLFVSTTAVGQQINPVPDYIFRNSMSVGRNAPTDTSAYFSIGPRFGATRGFMPPMVVDTAAVTGTKRNGLLIYSIQRNSFLYWDSTGSRWSRIAANLDTLLLSTRAWRQKGDDSLASIINTRTDTVNRLSTKAWRQKGIDSVAALVGSNLTGTGISGYMPKWTGTKALDTSQIFQLANRIGIGQTNPTNRLDVNGTGNFSDTLKGTLARFTATSENVIIAKSNQTFNKILIDGNTGSSSQLAFFENGAQKSVIGYTPSTLLTFINNGSKNVLVVDAEDSVRITGSLNVSTNARINGTTILDNTLTGTSATFNSTTEDNIIVKSTQNFSKIRIDAITNGSSQLSFFENGSQKGIIGYRPSTGMTFISNNVKDMLNLNSGNEVIINGTVDSGNYTLQVIGSIFATTGPNVFNATSGETLFGTSVDAGDYRVQIAGNLYNTTSAYFNISSGETYIGTTSDAGAFRLQVNGVARASDGLATGAPAGGTAATWKLGIVVAGSYTAASNYLQVDVGGTLYYIGLVTPN